jgi:membrane associated rhomboid family serine protease
MSRSPGTFTILGIYVVIFIAFGLSEPSRENLIRAGAQDNAFVAAGEYWRLISACFVHIGLVHILINGYFLWVVGPVLERELGLERFLVLYLLAGLGGSVAVGLLYWPGMIAAGGSGALFGFLGALVALILRRGHSYRDFLDNMAGRQLLFLILINLALGWLVPFISNTAHIGGLLAGFSVTFLWLRLPEAGGRLARAPLFPAVALGLLLASLTFVACRPVFSKWFQARTMWTLEDSERRDAIRTGLVARGVPDRVLDFLVTTRRFALGKPEPGAEQKVVAAVSGNSGLVSRELALLGINPLVFNRFLDALGKGNDNPGRYLPLDPWLRYAD